LRSHGHIILLKLLGSRESEPRPKDAGKHKALIGTFRDAAVMRWTWTSRSAAHIQGIGYLSRMNWEAFDVRKHAQKETARRPALLRRARQHLLSRDRRKPSLHGRRPVRLRSRSGGPQARPCSTLRMCKSCCSLLSITKYADHPPMRTLRCRYFSGSSIARLSSSTSVTVRVSMLPP
jgi:hypothetical protein